MSNLERPQHVSMKELARELGVSVPTISRALRNSPEVSVALKEKVKKLAEDWNYRPNPFAQSLRKGAPKIIGVIVPDVTTHFHSSVIAGIEREARNEGYSVICANSHERFDDEESCIENLTSMHVVGIIACIAQDTSTYDHFMQLDEENIPTVFFARTCLNDKFSSVISNGVEGAQNATRHLLDGGRRRIGFIGGPSHLDMVKRRKHGYLEALRDAHVTIDSGLVKCRELTKDAAYASTKELINLYPDLDAVLAVNDLGIYGALRAIKESGKRIPEDIALIGFTDNPDVEYITPSISAISDQARKMGHTACRLLIDRINGNNAVRHVVLPMELVIRKSTAPNQTSPTGEE